MVNNPTELRARLRELFAAAPLVIGGQTFGQEVTDEAIEELVGALVRSYLQEGEPTACEKIVGTLFIALLQEKEVTTSAGTAPPA